MYALECIEIEVLRRTARIQRLCRKFEDMTRDRVVADFSTGAISSAHGFLGQEETLAALSDFACRDDHGCYEKEKTSKYVSG